MDLLKFVPEQLLILVAACYAIGVFLKNSPKVQDWTIPWILVVFGIVFSILIGGISATSILQGIICAAVAVMSNQLIKQTTNRE